MSDATFPNGQTLSSSALTPKGIETVFQALVMRIFGITVDPKNPDAAYRQVRVGWQQQGQPSWKIDEDVCIITAKPLNQPFSQVRDRLNAPNDATTVSQQMSFTQVWGIHFTLYGPNCYDRARLISSAMTLDWVHDALQYPPNPVTSQIYVVPEWKRPVYGPENFQGQWWQRSDLDMNFNELAFESIAVDSATAVTINLLEENNFRTTFTIPL